MRLPLRLGNRLQLRFRWGRIPVAHGADAPLCLLRLVALVNMSFCRRGPLRDMGFAERFERYLLPAGKMKPCIEPGRGVKVHPARPMAHAGIEAVFDLRNSGRESGYACVQVVEEAGAVMWCGD